MTTLYRDTHPGYCLENALSAAGHDIKFGEWPLIKDAVSILREHGFVVVDEGVFDWRVSDSYIVVFGDEKDEDGRIIAHAVFTTDICEWLEETIRMVVFLDGRKQ